VNKHRPFPLIFPVSAPVNAEGDSGEFPDIHPTMSDQSVFYACQQQVAAAQVTSGIVNATTAQLQQQYEALAKCVSDSFEEQRASDRLNVNHWLFVLAGSLVFIMQVGFAMLCAGCVRKKNVQKCVTQIQSDLVC
jgi:hypothetical protein